MSTTLLAPEKPLRFACNRCHSLKLRCPRSSELDKSGPDEPCSRCRKAGAPCIVSERGKVGRPAKRKATPPSPAVVRETSSRQSHRSSDFEKNQSVSGLIHVFGLGADSAIQQGGLSPPEHILSTVGSPAMTPMRQSSSTAISAMASEHSHENDEGDSDKTSWGSHDPWPTGPFSTDPNGFPVADSMLYEPFPQSIDLDLCPPTFHFPESTNMFDLPESRPEMKDKDGDYIFTSEFDTRPLQPTPPRHDRSASQSISDVSRTSCLLKLSDLHTRMLHSSERFRATDPLGPYSDPAMSVGNQIVLETVDFSGELIDAARQNLPSFFSGASSKSTTPSRKMTPSDDDDSDSPVPSAVPSVDDWVTLGSALPTPCIPESAVIFLLLGCYTQLLYSFEVAIDCFYSEYQSSKQSKDQGAGTANSLLKASLSIHTVIYLLGRVHKAFATPETDGSTDGSDIAPEDAAHPVDMKDWKKSLMGNKSIDEGLLGRVFNEIQEREQRLMGKATHLRQMINRFQI